MIRPLADLHLEQGFKSRAQVTSQHSYLPSFVWIPWENENVLVITQDRTKQIQAVLLSNHPPIVCDGTKALSRLEKKKEERRIINYKVQ